MADKINKKAISIRVDEDILDYFKKSGSGYQSKMHAILREFVDTEKVSNTEN